MAYIYPFRMASGTATMLVIDPVNKRFCNGIRSKTAWVYPESNSLPGGFMEARFTEEHADKQALARASAKVHLDWNLVGDEFHEGENLEDCAIRELLEELNTVFTKDQLNMFAVRSNSRTDTRAHVINACYWLEATPEQIASMEAGDDLDGIEWVEFDTILDQPIEMAFNHMEVTYQGIRAYCRHVVTEKLIARAVADEDDIITDYLAVDRQLSGLEKQVANA